jgi:hypothetical protein
MRNSKTWAPALLATAALTACFGGGDDDTPAPTSLTISGTAAKGAALAGASVDVKCATGTGTATTDGGGAYSLTLDAASLPCALRATGTEGSIFHSVAAGSGGGSQRSNLTPLTEMLVAQLAGGASPASFFAGFSSNSAVSSASLTQAVDYLKTALAGVTDITGVNPATDALAVGDTRDQQIEAVVAALTKAGVTLSALTAAIAANPGAPSVITAPLAPAAADCAWLKSGKYRMIEPFESDPLLRSYVITIDAVAKTAKLPDGTTASFTSNGACQFTSDSPEETIRIMVSQAGALVVYSDFKPPQTGRDITIGLPDQTLPLAELAGTWNIAGWGPIAPASFVAATAELTFDASGNATAASACLGLLPCVPLGVPLPKVTVNTVSGGFDVSEGGVNTGRAFAFKTLAGKAAWLHIENDGSLLAGMRQQALGDLPAVGTVTNFRQFQLNGNGTIADLLDETVTVTANDATARTVTRVRTSDGRVDTLAFDKPRDGLRYREANSCTINNAPFNCREIVQMPMSGMGITLSLSVGTSSATAFYDVSVNKPN